MDAQGLINIIHLESLSPQQRLDVLEGLLKAQPSIPSTPMAPVALVELPQPLQRGNVVIPQGGICQCALCNKAIYRIINDVYEHMKIISFLACFAPVTEDIKHMTKESDIWGDPYGNLAVDCPLCKGRKTVWIKGKGEKLFDDYPEGSAYQDVNSQGG